MLVDLGCGPGFTSLELAQIVGSGGRVIARDMSPRFLEFLRAECDRLAYSHVEPSLGPVEELDLRDGSVDAAYARWLLCWVADPGAVLARVTRSLRSGGVLVLQEYLDWAAMKLVPRSDAFDRAIEACMRSWEEGDATIDIGERIPALAADCGLEVEHFRPLARSGHPGSLVWRWLSDFLHSYLPKLIERGFLAPEELDAYVDDWRVRAKEGTSHVLAPTMVDVVLRKP